MSFIDFGKLCDNTISGLIVNQEDFDEMFRNVGSNCFEHLTFRFCCFKNIKSIISFNDCHFYETEFDNCSFKNVIFVDCTFDSVRIDRDTNFHDTLFKLCNFGYTQFLSSTSLSNVAFQRCNFDQTKFIDMDLFNTEIRWEVCSFNKMDFSEARTVPNIPLACPEKGKFIAYKKALLKRSTDHDPYVGVIVKLEIPEDALRSSSTSHKCRCSKAKVLEIQAITGTVLDDSTIAESDFNSEFSYEKGQIVSVPDFDQNRWNECTHGIHFFMSREEAVKYPLINAMWAY